MSAVFIRNLRMSARFAMRGFSKYARGSAMPLLHWKSPTLTDGKN